MIRIFTIAILLIIHTTALGQTSQDSTKAPDNSTDENLYNEIFYIVDEMPAPVEGMQKFKAYLSKNLKYPSMAYQFGAQGSVTVQFIVDTNGVANDIQVVKGMGMGCDEEAVRLIKNMPNWKPGKQRGRKVRVRTTIDVIFKL